MSWSGWLSSDEIRQLRDRNPGRTLDQIAMDAMQNPWYAREFARLGAWIETWEDQQRALEVRGLIRPVYKWGVFPRLIVPEHSEQEFARLVVAAMLEPAAKARRDSHGQAKTPAPIPLELVENAVALHEAEGLGRRKLANRVPGLTEYQAGQVLGWYRIGKPGGLWLEGDRLKWSKAISTTRDGMSLPRL